MNLETTNFLGSDYARFYNPTMTTVLTQQSVEDGTRQISNIYGSSNPYSTDFATRGVEQVQLPNITYGNNSVDPFSSLSSSELEKNRSMESYSSIYKSAPQFEYRNIIGLMHNVPSAVTNGTPYDMTRKAEFLRQSIIADIEARHQESVIVPKEGAQYLNLSIYGHGKDADAGLKTRAGDHIHDAMGKAFQRGGNPETDGVHSAIYSNVQEEIERAAIDPNFYASKSGPQSNLHPSNIVNPAISNIRARNDGKINMIDQSVLVGQRGNVGSSKLEQNTQVNRLSSNRNGDVTSNYMSDAAQVLRNTSAYVNDRIAMNAQPKVLLQRSDGKSVNLSDTELQTIDHVNKLRGKHDRVHEHRLQITPASNHTPYSIKSDFRGGDEGAIYNGAEANAKIQSVVTSTPFISNVLPVSNKNKVNAGLTLQPSLMQHAVSNPVELNTIAANVNTSVMGNMRTQSMDKDKRTSRPSGPKTTTSRVFDTKSVQHSSSFKVMNPEDKQNHNHYQQSLRPIGLGVFANSNQHLYRAWTSAR